MQPPKRYPATCVGRRPHSSAPLLGGGAEAFLWETRIALALWAVAPTEQDPACGAAWPLEDPPLAVVELLGE